MPGVEEDELSAGIQRWKLGGAEVVENRHSKRGHNYNRESWKQPAWRPMLPLETVKGKRMHGPMMNQANFTTVVFKSSDVERLTGHMYTEYDSI